MKALKYYVMSAMVLISLTGNVYASSPAYTEFAALENGVYSFFKIIYYIFMFLLILAAAYYATKFLAKKGMVQGKTKSMKLIENMPLGADRSLSLIKVGGQYFLIGNAGKSMVLISEIDQEKLFDEQMDQPFSLNDFEYDSYEDNIEGKDFSSYLGSVKTNLNKLKSMVRGNNKDEL